VTKFAREAVRKKFFVLTFQKLRIHELEHGKTLGWVYEFALDHPCHEIQETTSNFCSIELTSGFHIVNCSIIIHHILSSKRSTKPNRFQSNWTYSACESAPNTC